MNPLVIAGLGTPELLIILAVVILLFGASKLPELARGSGRALRIFKAETKGLGDDDDLKTPEQLELEAQLHEMAQRILHRRERAVRSHDERSYLADLGRPEAARVSQTARIAEANGVTICVELLNSKVDHKDYTDVMIPMGSNTDSSG